MNTKKSVKPASRKSSITTEKKYVEAKKIANSEFEKLFELKLRSLLKK